MPIRRICSLLFAFCLAQTGFSQQSFISSQEKILSLSENQWLCLELKSVNKKHFDCANSSNSWRYPETDSLKFGDQLILVPLTEREIFRELLFPDGNCERYLALISLCDLYFPLFRKKTEEVGIHSDYKYLPLLLSGCNQGFKSNDHSGIWAMDYLVSRKMHLRVDTLIDERNGGDFTTTAALKYLQELNGKYNGDIVKCIAAYRLGIPTISRLSTPSGDNTFDILPEDEQRSIQFLAYVKFILESTRSQNQLQNYFDIFALHEGVVMEKDTKLEALKQVIGLETSQAREVNPVFIGSKIPALYRKVPFMMPTATAANWKLQKDSVARWQPPILTTLPDTVTSIVYHTVKRGESLGSIARKHHTTVRKIKNLNKLKSDKIRQGQKLVVARQTQTASPEVKTESIPVTNDKNNSEIKPKKKKSEENTITYKVKNGDSLWKIANKYKGVTPDDIKRWNKCGDDLRPGQKLIIHLSK
ncbi:MAG: LysM peptidoglycan-binding domain-containing protein [Flavobacteriales bacterium]